MNGSRNIARPVYVRPIVKRADPNSYVKGLLCMCIGYCGALMILALIALKA